ncbi:LuxR C-terminal-related transcriptional regulator [Micromonospora sp. NPDC049679]|uniref:LuxR C-terminal-related transcriptional regulator n=1 Tax=Micromonospora sp. NPDC049679 TaxID=3155920 RepID=UPI00340F0FBD
MREDVTGVGPDPRERPRDDRVGVGVAGPANSAQLVVPRLPDRLVERPRLGRLVDVRTGPPVTLLAAPAGWGKTTLLAVAARQAAENAPVGWVSLRPGDDDRFWSHLHTVLPTSGGHRAPPPGRAPQRDHLARLAAALAGRPAPTVLVLDDLHHIRDAGVLHGLVFLLRHTAGRLRLLLSTRSTPELPLHRWRVTGELTELGPAELAFTPAETAQLVAAHGLAAPRDDLDRLQHRSEGWPAAVRLAVLALRDGTGPSVTTGIDQRLADYLLDEFRAQTPAGLRDVLLRASLLDRISAGPLQALTGRTDGDRLLRKLARAGGCLSPATGRPATYRFHPLLPEVLRAELGRRAPEEIPRLHRRVAHWYAAQGQPVPALRHALAAGDRDHATALLLRHWPAFALGGGLARPTPAPPPAPPPGTLPDDPELALAYAADRHARLDPDSAEGYLRIAERHARLLTGAHRTRLTVMATAFRLAGAHRRGDTARIRALATRLIALTGREDLGADELPSADTARAIALTASGDVRLAGGEFPAAEIGLLAGFAAAERGGLPLWRRACLGRLAFLRAVRGELSGAERAARGAIGGGPDGDRPLPCAAYAHLALCLVALERDRLDDAEAQLSLAAGGPDAGAGPTLPAWAAAVRALLLQARGDQVGALEAIRAGRRERGDWRPPRYLAQWCAAVEAELLIACGETGEAQRILAPLVAGDATPPALLAVPLARSYLHDGDPHAAIRLLPAWAEDARLPLPLRLAAGLLESVAAHHMDDQRRVHAALGRLRDLAEPEGFRSVFTRAAPQAREPLAARLDALGGYARVDAAASGGTTGPVASPGADGPGAVPGEPLTDRELTVLRYLQSILSNVEIAAELRLSVNTIKTHVRSIYRKLDTSRRREAVRRARELRLI